jgi:hypothetical protein
VIGGAYGRSPVMKEVKLEAERRQVELVLVPTSEAIRLIEKESAPAFRGEPPLLFAGVVNNTLQMRRSGRIFSCPGGDLLRLAVRAKL